MSANRTGSRRSGVPLILTPKPKCSIAMERWEAKAPLSQQETRSIDSIKANGERAPLPLKVLLQMFEVMEILVIPITIKLSSDEAGPSCPSTQILTQRSRQVPASLRPTTLLSTSAPSGSTAATSRALHPEQPVQTPHQSHDWFALIDHLVAQSQEAHFRAHIANVSNHLDTCDQLVAKIDLIEKEVDGMLADCGGRREERV